MLVFQLSLLEELTHILRIITLKKILVLFNVHQNFWLVLVENFLVIICILSIGF